MIEITSAPPYLTVQDLGRPGYRAQGVPAGGAMDPTALSIANVLAGNAPSTGALEWALGGGAVHLDRPCAFAVAGADVEATLDGQPLAMHTTYRATVGSVLTIHRIVAGRFAYVGLEGGIDVPVVLGGRATYLPGRFGGLEGRLLRSGDRLPLGSSGATAPRTGFAVPAELLPHYESASCRILPAGSHDLGGRGAAWLRLVTESYRVERSSDRIGYRLSGASLGDCGSLPSEPVLPGVVQVPHGGQPIVLMADGPTVGGYPVIGVISSVDLPLLAQREPGAEVRFAPITLAEAQRSVRRLASKIHTLRHLATAK
jgi:biotin-dependent carboxylase-like uncharacterized protein